MNPTQADGWLEWGTSQCCGELFFLSYKYGGGEGGDGDGSCLRVVGGLASRWVAGALLDWVEFELEALEASVSESSLVIRRVEDHNNVLVLAVVAAVGVKLHDDEAGGLALSCVKEGEVLLDLSERGHAEEIGAIADLEQVFKCLVAVGDVGGLRCVGGV